MNDLKPGTVLVTKTGVRRVDFGLANAIQLDPLNGMTVSAPLTGAGPILGTPGARGSVILRPPLACRLSIRS